jgi:hypothetical protein
VKIGATEFPNSVPPRFQTLAVGPANTKLVPPVSQKWCHRVWHRVKPEDVYVWFLCLSQLTRVTWALRHYQNSLWCIPLDSTTYLYSRSNIKSNIRTLELLLQEWPYLINISSWEIHPSMPHWFEYFYLELVTLIFIREWSPILDQVTLHMTQWICNASSLLHSVRLVLIPRNFPSYSHFTLAKHMVQVTTRPTLA